MQFYKTQNESFKGEGDFYYASDLTKGGAKEYGVSTLSNFIPLYQKRKFKHFYELLKSDRPRHAYFDLDVKDREDLTPEEVFDSFRETYMRYQAFNDLPISTDFRVSDSTTANRDKISLHIIDKNVIWINWADGDRESKKFFEYVDCDNSVYSKNRCMRMIGSSKFGQIRPFERASWHEDSKNAPIEDFFIQNLDKDVYIKTIKNKERKKFC